MQQIYVSKFIFPIKIQAKLNNLNTYILHTSIVFIKFKLTDRIFFSIETQ